MAVGVSAKLRQMTMVGGCTAAPGDTQTKADTGSSSNGKVDDTEVHTQIYKDGYWNVGCMADGMYAKGDKFGDGAMAYERATRTTRRSCGTTCTWSARTRRR